MAYSEITIVNCTTGKIVVREMTKIEHDQKLTDEKQNVDSVEKQKQDDLARTAARLALLDRLGLTEQEAQLLLGS